MIDEFHHAEAATYRRIIDHLVAARAAGSDRDARARRRRRRPVFFGGRTAAELRLWDALGADLLCPFHYFAVADGTDLRGVSWSRGRYDEAELSNVYTGNKARAAIVLTQLRDKVLDLGAMRALGFCVSVAHARVHGPASSARLASRRGRQRQTRRPTASSPGRPARPTVNALFAADLFNEGLDLPDVDTVLFLRPTESATVFLQQLGRGLRRTRDKAVLTVLDFVGLSPQGVPLRPEAAEP